MGIGDMDGPGLRSLDASRAQDGRTALHQACLAGNLYAAELLIENGASVRVADAQGNTPLHVAASNWKVPEMAALLVRTKADVTATNAKGQTPAGIAAASHPEAGEKRNGGR